MRRKRIPKGRNRHHILPRSRGGRNSISNILLVDIEKHKCFHILFGNRTIDEVIELLSRLEQAKRRQRVRSY